MKQLLVVSRWIDALTMGVGKIAIWAIFASTAISAGNALVRYIFGWGSNAMLEIQWYLFAGVFTLGAGYGFLRNVHVRIDFLSHKLSDRSRNWIDVGGIVLFLLPFCVFMITLGGPLMVSAYVSNEMSFNPGGLVRWPIYAFIPFGFGLLGLQGISELIKRLNFLWGDGPDVLAHGHETATEPAPGLEAKS